MVTFYEERPAPEPSDLTDIERALGVPSPPALRRLFVDHNGGRPDENHFRCSTLQTDVSECVEVRSGRGGALWVYELLRSRGLPRHLFPFANDSGGNYFLLSCEIDNGEVMFHPHEDPFRLIPVGVSFNEFWARLES
jgi:hypothetical protein